MACTISPSSIAKMSLPPAGSGELRGPTDSSNWVIPGRLLTGAYPGGFSSEGTRGDITKLLKAG